MKKLLSLLMVLAMIIGMVGCASTNPEDEYVDHNDQETLDQLDQIVQQQQGFKNTDRYPLQTNISLRVLFTEDTLGDTDASRLWEEVTGVQLDNLAWNGTQLMTSLAAGDIPDAIVMPWNFDKSTVYEYGSSGQFLDFKQYILDGKMPNLAKLIVEYPEILDVCRYPDGAMYSLPKVGWSNTYQSNLLYIRTDLLEQMGWDHAPQNADEFLTFIKEAQAKFASDPQFKAFMPQNSNYMNWNGMNTISSTFFSSFGSLVETGLTVDAAGEVVLGAATEQYRYYLEFMHEIWTSGAFETEVYTMDAAAGKATIQDGHCIVSIGTSAPATYFSDGVAHVEVMQPLTSKYQGQKQWMKTPLINYRGCVASAAVANDPEKLDVLLAWLDSFYAPEDNPLNTEGTIYGYSITKGELGVHWNKDDAAQTWSSVPGVTFGSYADALYTGNFTYIPLQNLNVKGQGTNDNLLPYAVPVSGLSSLALSKTDQDDYNALWGDLDKYIGQMHAKFITGAEDIDTGWDAYLDDLEQMGLLEVLEIYQRAYDHNQSQKNG